MSKNNNRYSDFSSQINPSSEEVNVTSTLSETTSPKADPTQVDPIKVTEPQLLTPTAASGAAPTAPINTPKAPVASQDQDLRNFIIMRDNFIDLNKSHLISKKDRERSAFALLRLVQLALAKDKRSIYDELYKFVKQYRDSILNPINAFAGGDEKMKRSEIGELTMVIAAIHRTQDGHNVDFKEITRCFPNDPVLVTYLSEKLSRKSTQS
jgi:hypothetical protein